MDLGPGPSIRGVLGSYSVASPAVKWRRVHMTATKQRWWCWHEVRVMLMSERGMGYYDAWYPSHRHWNCGGEDGLAAIMAEAVEAISQWHESVYGRVLDRLVDMVHLRLNDAGNMAYQARFASRPRASASQFRGHTNGLPCPGRCANG